MKYTYKLLSVAALMIAVACTENITSLNINPKSYTTVPGASLFTNAQRNLINAMTSANVNQGNFRLHVQHWTETTYLDETQYDLAARNIPQNFWNLLYRDVLKDFQEATRLITKDPVSDTRNNQLAMIDIMVVYTYSTLVNTFGDIPYSKALDFNNLTPAYDDAAAIYSDLLTRLDADIAALKVAGDGFGGGQDLMYDGDTGAWIKFATSLKLRLAMTIADADNAKAKAAAESAFASGNLIASNDESGKIAYLGDPPNTNPVWTDLVQSGRQDYVAANNIVDIMNTLSDPRRALFFTQNGAGTGYTGGIPGVGNLYATYSKPADMLTEATFPGVLIDAAETAFYLAEAAARGYSVGLTADVHYANAITLSITDWGGTDADALAYLAQPSVAYATATGSDFRQKIGTQKYIALYNRGFEAWTEFRRFDFPVMNPVVGARSGYPNRYIYPVNEQNLNTANFAAAAAKVAGGADKVEAKLFWDKF